MSESLRGYTALFGGSFNPPHMGHQMLVLHLLEALAADEVWLAPAHTHPFGKRLCPFEARVTMCNMVVRPFGDRARVTTVEETLHGQGRTYELLRHFKHAWPKRHFALAVGADILSETSQWHRWDDIQSMVRVVVIGRAGFATADSHGIELPRVSSRYLRQRVHDGRSVRGWVPDSVASYIEEHGLYQ